MDKSVNELSSKIDELLKESSRKGIRIPLSYIARLSGFNSGMIGKIYHGKYESGIKDESYNAIMEAIDLLHEDPKAGAVERGDYSVDSIPNVPVSTLRDILKKYKYTNDKNYTELGASIGVSSASISNFLKRTDLSPHRGTLAKVSEFLQNEGYMSRLGIPTTKEDITSTHMLSDHTDGPINPLSDKEKNVLEGMGIHQMPKTKEGDRELNDMQDEWTDMLTIHAIVNSEIMSQSQKIKVLKGIFPSKFS